MDKREKTYWFKRRRYGWGWVPVTWQGWALIAGYLVVVIALAPAFLDAPEPDRAREAGFYFLFLALATAGLVKISFAKGPRPRWRWGATPDDNPDEDF